MASNTYRSVAIGRSDCTSEGISIFYPEEYEAAHHSPSFALKTEPEPFGEAPKSWKLRPKFFASRKTFRFTIELDHGTSLYGTGEVTGDLERHGTLVKLWNTDNWVYGKDKGKRLYQSHPWLLGVRKDGTAFGVLADTTWYSEMNLIKRKQMVFTSHGPRFRVIVVDRESPQAVMKGLAELTGTMEMPPMWALGYQQCRWSYYPDSRVREIADEFRARGIPCDVIWFDIHYMDGYRIFTFDKTLFPSPKRTNAYLHKRGFKSVWMIDPGVKKEKGYKIYDAGSTRDVWVKDKHGNEFNGDVWPGSCAFPDFTSSEVREWWAALYKDFMAQGVDGVWNDMNEPAVGNGPDGTMPVDNQHRGGGELSAGPHARYHNVYGMLMVMATREGVRACNPDKRPFVLTRSNYLGGHRYAATWTGDNTSSWDHLKLSVPMCLTLGLSGQPFNGPDIGGFAGEPTPDMWGHWIAVGAFFPFSRGHAAQGTTDKEPWAFGPQIERAAKVALERRYRLMPYYYTLFQEASQVGLPVMRPVFFANPADCALREEQSAFLVGADLLVVPKWAKDTAIPKGFNRSISLVGENAAKDHFQCDLRIRDGAILPLTKVMQSTEEFDHQDLTLMIQLDTEGRATGELYEDANDGFGYVNGEYRKTTFVAERNGETLTVNRSVKGSFKVPNRKITIILLADNDEFTHIVAEKRAMVISGIQQAIDPQ